MRGEVRGKNFPKLHWYHHPFLRHSIQNSADCAVKNTALMLETTKKLKKVENVSACSSRCNQEPSCEFYKWKVNHICRKTFTINILVTLDQDNKKASRRECHLMRISLDILWSRVWYLLFQDSKKASRRECHLMRVKKTAKKNFWSAPRNCWALTMKMEIISTDVHWTLDILS